MRFAPADGLVTHGATAGLGAVMLGVIDPGITSAFPEPCYSLYPDLVRLAGGGPVLVPCAADLHFGADAHRWSIRRVRENPEIASSPGFGVADLDRAGRHRLRLS